MKTIEICLKNNKQRIQQLREQRLEIDARLDERFKQSTELDKLKYEFEQKQKK